MTEDDTFRRLLQTPRMEMIDIFNEWNEDFNDERTFDQVLRENNWTTEDWNHLAKQNGMMIYDPQNPKSAASYGFRHWGEDEK